MANTTLRLALMSALMLTAACAKKPRPGDIPPAPAAASDGSDTSSSSGDGQIGGAVVPGSREDFLQQAGSDTVRFGLDSYELDGEATAILDRQAAWLKRYPRVRASIEGHCDERGTREYNLALGERRASAARNYLANAGVTNQLSVLSYGKERPVAVGSDDASYAQNRRAATITIS